MLPMFSRLCTSQAAMCMRVDWCITWKKEKEEEDNPPMF